MEELNKIREEDTKEIIGGGVSGSVLSGVAGLIKNIYTIGQGLGSAIRRLAGNKVCPL